MLLSSFFVVVELQRGIEAGVGVRGDLVISVDAFLQARHPLRYGRVPPGDHRTAHIGGSRELGSKASHVLGRNVAQGTGRRNGPGGAVQTPRHPLSDNRRIPV